MEQASAPSITTVHSGRSVETTPPRVDVLIVNTRNNEWSLGAIDSAKSQSYDNTGVLVLDNTKRKLSIGAAYNALVKHSQADEVLFLGDDDQLTVEMVGAMLACKRQACKRAPSVVHVTTPCILMDKASGRELNAHALQQGMFTRAWLLANPFNEALTKGIHTDTFQRLDAHTRLTNQPQSMPLMHLRGYIMGIHVGMASGLNTKLPR